MRKNPAYIFLAVIIVLLIGSQAIFTTFQTEKAIVLMLGDPKNEVYGPGLHFKIPFIEKAVFFDSRVLDYTASSREALYSTTTPAGVSSILCSFTAPCGPLTVPRPVSMTWFTPSCAPWLAPIRFRRSFPHRGLPS